MLIAAHYPEFFGQLYLAIEGGRRRGYDPRHVIDLAMPELAEMSCTADLDLCEIMFVMEEEGYPEYLEVVAQRLSEMPAYHGRDLPMSLNQFDTLEMQAERKGWRLS